MRPQSYREPFNTCDSCKHYKFFTNEESPFCSLGANIEMWRSSCDVKIDGKWLQAYDEELHSRMVRPSGTCDEWAEDK